MGSLGVVISVFNEEKELRTNLPHFVDVFDEIVVVDNHSTDSSVEVCRRFPVKVVFPEKGSNRGRCWNVGAANIRSDYILFLPVDTYLVHNFGVDMLHENCRNDDFEYSCFRIRYEESFFGYRCIELFAGLRSRLLRIVYLDQALCVKRSVFEEINGFPDVPILEDWEISKRLKPYRFKWIPSAIYPSSRGFEERGFFVYLLILWRTYLTIWPGRGIDRMRLFERYYRRES